MAKGRLEETKGSFKLAGIVSGLSNKNAFAEGLGKTNKKWQKVQFYLQTSPVNRVPVEVFGSERDFINPYSRQAGGSTQVAWNMRDKIPQGYHIIGVNATLTVGADGKPKKISLVEFDAVNHLLQNLSDGDQLWINGEFDFDKYEKNGTMVNTTRFQIKHVGRVEKGIDFNAPDFKERAEFEQEIIVSDTMVDRETNKVIVNAYIIGYGDKIKEAQFTIDMEKNKEFASNFVKRCAYGTFIKVYGKVVNAVELGDPEPLVDEWGGEIPDSYSRPIKNVIRELQLSGATDYESKKYKETDLFPLADSHEEVPFDEDYEWAKG